VVLRLPLYLAKWLDPRNKKRFLEDAEKGAIIARKI
jgi:hypothetical protein